MLNITHLFLLLIPVILLYILLIYKMNDKVEKVYVSIIFFGLYFYGGIGASSVTASGVYTIYYLVFTAVFVFFYRLKYKFAHALKNSVTSFYDIKGATLFDTPFSNARMIYLYLIFEVSSLLYPKFIIATLIHPPAPDVLSSLLGTIDTSVANVDVLSKILFYFRLLFLPLYLMALNSKINKPVQLFFLLFLPLYIDYCSSSYIARGAILINLVVWLFTVYTYNKKLRPALLAGCFLLAPIMLFLFYTYSVARISSEFSADFNGKMIEHLLYQEVNFPDHFEAVVNSGKHVDFAGFLVWLFTLPFPKFLVGGINVPLINFELSEIVIGTSRNEQGFWVELTGYISESYYIFGKYFFWLEAVLIAWLSKSMFYFFRKIKGSRILLCFVAMQFGFTFSRGGIESVVPNLINGFLAVYFYFGLKIYLKNRAANKLRQV